MGAGDVGARGRQGRPRVAVRESVQRLEATGDVRTREGALEAGGWTKAAALRPEGATQRQPVAQSVVDAYSGTCLA